MAGKAVIVSVKGLDKVIQAIEDMGKNVHEVFGRALYEEAQVEMEEAKARVPVDSGTLRASGTVGEPEFEGEQISVTLSFGGAASAYALAVHEHLSEHSPPSWIKAEQNGDGVQWSVPGTGPKYLESVINESAKHFTYRVANRVAMNELVKK